MPESAWEDPRPAVWSATPGDRLEARRLAAETGVSEIVAGILLHRGYREAAAARAFLNPSLGQLSDPAELPDLGVAAERVRSAVRSRERILVCGDYDVDGISGTALLVGLLRLLGATVSSYLPNRLDEGYGLSEESVRRFAEEGIDLLVTVDHGTTAVAEIALARELGMDVVVVDHHLPGETRPPATAMVNPHLGAGPGPHPCGTGVAFKLAWGIATAFSGGPKVAEAHRAYLTDALALVALGTIADVVPLGGDNRVFASFGLRMLAKTPRPGIRALLRTTKLETAKITATDIGFKLAPRLNAAGRMGRAELALELLVTDDAERAREIAAILESENRRRREIEAEILEKAHERIERDYEPGHRGGLALGDPSWHPGVVGIVAARIVDRYHRPAAVVAFEGGIGRGSCRTIPAVALPDALAPCDEHLESWGGHAAAAGFTVRPEKFEAFRAAFDRAVADLLRPEDLVRRLRIDAETPLSGVGPALVRDLARLAPFGAGNREPVLASRGVRIAGRPRRMGKDGAHLSFLASDGSVTHRAVGFSMGPLAERIEADGRVVDIAFSLRFDDYRGDGSIELRLRDLAFPEDRDG